MKNLTLSKALSLAIVAAIAFGLRFYRLSEIPGFEHDEALICNGAKSLAARGEWYLTGDKVYEGPLLEYALAGVFKVFGASVGTARAVMAVSGALAVVFAAPVAIRYLGFVPGLGAAFFIAVSPWAFMTSRVIYICNLVPMLLSAALLSAHYASARRIWPLIAALFMVGLAMQGHFFAALTAVPLVYLCRPYWAGRRQRQVLVFGGGFLALLLANAPMLLFNAHNGFPFLSVLFGSERHAFSLSAGLGGAASRLAGYIFTAIHSQTGCYLWPDIRLPEGFMVALPALMGIGTVFIAHGAWRGNRFDRTLVVWAALTLAIVPLITKHRLEWKVWYFAAPSLPHYMDVLFPLPYLAAGRVLTGLRGWRPVARAAPLLILLVGLENLFFFRSYLFPAFADPAVTGRWRPGIQAVAARIGRELSAGSPVFVSYVFEGGFPQLRFLLDDHPVYPGLFEPTGWYDEAGRLKSGEAVYVARGPKKPVQFADLEPWLRVGPESFPLWLAYRYETPSLALHGKIQCQNGSRLALDLQVGAKDSGRLAIEHEDGTRFTIEGLTRRDHLAIEPSIAKRSYAITTRHRTTLQQLQKLYAGSSIVGGGWTIDLIPRQNTIVSIRTPDNEQIVCEHLDGVFYAR